MMAMRVRMDGGGWKARVPGLALTSALTTALHAQTPLPFPRAGQPAVAPRTQAPAPRAPAPRAPATQSPAAQPPAPQVPPPAAARTQTPATPPATPAPGTPTAATLGFPIYPGAQYLASYDAGRGQRYYLFGTTAPYADIVLYYRTQLDERGDVVFREPPTHMFSIGRFRDETMAFPPGVTVKDWTWGGSQGYPNTRLGAEPARFPTVIMIVPQPAPAPNALAR